MSDGHVDVGAASDPGGDVVDVEVQVLVDAGLQAERSDDPGLVVLLRGLHVFLGHLERLVEKGLPEGGGVVSAYGVLGDDAVLLQFHLLFGGEPDVAVEGGLEPPVLLRNEFTVRAAANYRLHSQINASITFNSTFTSNYR